jgi:uncharacterized protein YdcH (DUF465 family)
MRQTWTDDRMDDLAGRVDAGFAQVDQRFDKVHDEIAALRHGQERLGSEFRNETKQLGGELRGEIAALRSSQERLGSEFRKELKELGAELRKEINGLGARFDRLLTTLTAGFFSLVVALIASHAF